MTDQTITRLNEALEGRYRIERELGAGGMATVYLAQDVRHDRHVAIKVLRPELAAVIGGERFVVEIKTTAALQHPHILPLFDSGESGGFLYYVMPYIEGESLRDRLDREKQLGVQESLDLIEDVADALSYAHRQGVIHRDIKPANILLHDGRPVVADFGIAVAISAAGGGRMTETGLSLGTPFYMSPEQATADRELSPRSDVYSLACVLYEMLTGDPPHTASTAQAVLVRILTEVPRPARQIRPSVPENVSGALAKALEKLPADRFESAEGFSQALKDDRFHWTASMVPGAGGGAGGADTGAGGAGAGPGGGGAAGGRRGGAGGGAGHDARRRVLTPAGIAVAVAVGAVAFAGGWGLHRPEPSSDSGGAVIRMPFDSAAGINRAAEFAISSDGSRVVYNPSQSAEGLRVLFLDGSGERSLPETGDAAFPLFSQSGREVLFLSNDVTGIQRVGVDGGSPITILESGIGFPSEWTDDGGVLTSQLNGAYRIREGNESEQIHPATLLEARSFRTLPGGRKVTYTSMTLDSERSEVRVLDLDSGEDRTVVSDGFDARYLPTGHLVYGRFDQSLVAVPFDPDAGEVTGPSFTVMDSVVFNRTLGLLQLDVASNGTAVVVRGRMSAEDGGEERIVLVSLGSEEGPELEVLPIEAGSMGGPAASPDGRFLAYTDDPELVVYEFLTGRETRLSGELAMSPVWSPDGGTLAFVTFGSGGGSSDGVFSPRLWDWAQGQETRGLGVDAAAAAVSSWAADGSMLLMVGQSIAERDFDLVVKESEDAEPRPYLEARWAEEDGVFSPDGNWVAYTSDESGASQVYVRSFPEPGARISISNGPGATPQWTPDGRGIYFTAGDSLWLAELELEPEFRVSRRRAVLGRSVEEGTLGLFEYGVHPDGRIVATLTPRTEADSGDGGEDGDPGEDPGADDEEGRGRRTYLIVNWFEEIRRRAAGVGGS